MIKVKDREELEQISFYEDVKSIDELKEDDLVSGVVRNITDFGAFIDIGLKNDALLHISEFSHKKIKTHKMKHSIILICFTLLFSCVKNNKTTTINEFPTNSEVSKNKVLKTSKNNR